MQSEQTIYQMQSHLDQALQTQAHQFALTAKTESEFSHWQRDFRTALAEILGITDRIPTEVPKTTLVSSEDRETYVEELHNVVVDDLTMPMFLLIPKTPPPYKAIIALHGHGIGVNQIIGKYPTAQQAEERASVDGNYAQRYAEDGYLVCAIEQQGFGRRVADRVSDNANSCQQLAYQYLMSGQTLMGERVRDAIAAINYLQSRDDIVREAIGCTGHSGGGATALFLCALELRIKTAVISGYFCDYRESILGMRHCECNYVPNLLKLGNMGEVSALIAPRPLRLMNGESDPIFPIDGTIQPYEQVQSAYDILGSKSNVSLVKHPGGHRYSYPDSVAWFQAHL